MAYSVTSTHTRAACLFFASVLQITSAFGVESPSISSERTVPDSEAVARIVTCFSAGQEAVLFPEKVECAEYRRGDALHKKNAPDMPLKIDPAQICDAKDQPKDARRLSGDSIKRIVSITKSSPDPRGLRIIGAAFCEKLDLAGLDLNHSLVIDRSLFYQGLEVRNFRTRGDLSFDGSLALDEISIMRSSIGGSVFGSKAYIKQLRILDSEVKGSLLFRESTILGQAIFDTISLSGELSVRKTALSYFLVQFSKVGGVLDLTDSQARCAYLIKKSDIKDLVAVDAGFGTSASAQSAGKDITLFDWLIRPNAAASVKDMLGNSRLTPAGDKRECNYWTTEASFPGTFFVSDTAVGSSFCLRSFHWVASRPTGAPWGKVTLNDVTVGATSLIDLAPPANATTTVPLAKAGGPSRKFEAIGIKTHSLIFNFAEGAQMSDMFVGGLVFEQAYTAAPAVTCGYDPNYYKPPEEAGYQPENVGNARSQMRLPQVPEIMAWLDKNCLETTQPLSAFIDAAKKAGDVTDATELQIARERKELTLRIQRIINASTTSNCTKTQAPTTGSSTSSAKTGSSSFSFKSPSSLFSIAGVSSFFSVEAVSSFFDFVSDVVAVLFGALLWLFADHGYRPQKVGWLIAATMVGAWLYFWLRVRVVGFMPDKKDVIRPIGVAFLFDRLLPAYRIREEHYTIESYYKRASRSQRTGKCKEPVYLRHMKWLWFFDIPLVKANERDVQRVERCLDLVKGLGIILAIFLVAAFNTIFSH